MPKIGDLLNSADKQRLLNMGITFDSFDLMHVPPQFTCNVSLGSDNTFVTILEGNQEIVSINAKRTSYDSYCIAHWNTKTLE